MLLSCFCYFYYWCFYDGYLTYLFFTTVSDGGLSLYGSQTQSYRFRLFFSSIVQVCLPIGLSSPARVLKIATLSHMMSILNLIEILFSCLNFCSKSMTLITSSRESLIDLLQLLLHLLLVALPRLLLLDFCRV